MNGKYLGVHEPPTVFSLVPFATETPVHCSPDHYYAGYSTHVASSCPLCGSRVRISTRPDHTRGGMSQLPEVHHVCGGCFGFVLHAVLGPVSINFSFRVGFDAPISLSIPSRSGTNPVYMPRFTDTVQAFMRADSELMRFRAAFRTPDFQFKLFSVPGLGWVDLLNSMGCPRIGENWYRMMNFMPPEDDYPGSTMPLFWIERAEVYRFRPLRIFEGPEIDV